MSLTLGEKLRQAREEKGYTLSEVAENTRISSLYLESIENDDYKILPGGIFNKGFVKSYAKYVGVNEQEALADYARLIEEKEGSPTEDLKAYRPEVLTDDRSVGSMAPTIIGAVIILGLMTAGVLFLINYLRQPSELPGSNTAASNSINTNSNLSVDTEPPPPVAPTMESAKIELSSTAEPVAITATIDGKTGSQVVTQGTSVTLDPKESLKLSYSRSLAQVVRMTINDKPITLPASPFNPRRNVIEFEINQANIGQIWSSGSVVPPQPAETPTASQTEASPTGSPTQTPSTTPSATPAPTRTAATPRPANTAATPAASATPTRKPAPSLKPTIIPIATPKTP